MTATEIRSVVKSIRALPESKRTKAATRLVRELTPDTLESKVNAAISAGRFNGLFAKAMLDYSEGKALDRLD